MSFSFAGDATAGFQHLKAMGEVYFIKWSQFVNLH